jgi:hypothetical protein
MNLRGITQSRLKTPVRAPIRSALQGFPRNVATKVKSIFFIQTILVDDTQDLIDLLRLHADEIMFKSHWDDPTYVYDWDAHPAWDYNSGIRSTSAPAINGAQGGADGRGISGYASLANRVVSGDPTRRVAYVSWILYPGAAENVNNYRCGTLRQILPTTYWNSASLMHAVYQAGGSSYPYNGPDHLESTVLTIPPPADIDGVAAGHYEPIPIPDFAGIFDFGGLSLSDEMIFPYPNTHGVNPV